MAERRISYVKLGYAVRIHSEEIERLIRESTVEALPQNSDKQRKRARQKIGLTK
jgi:hypothetical protein